MDTRVRNVVWPAAFPDKPRARGPAHALAVLVVVTAVCAAFEGFYWADDDQVGPDRAGAVWAVVLMMAVPLLLMCALLVATLRVWRRVPARAVPVVVWTASAVAILWWWRGALDAAVPLLLMCGLLAGALRVGGVQYPVLVAVAWASSVLMTPLLLLMTSVTNDSDYCTAEAPEHPLSGNVVPLALLGALAAGSLAAWIVSALSRGRARPAVLYVVWLATVAAGVVLILAPQLHAARTCGPVGQFG